MSLLSWLCLGQAGSDAASAADAAVEAIAEVAPQAASSLTWVPWVGFLLLVFCLLALDLGVLNRKVHEVKTKEALKFTCLWISLALLFSVFIYFAYSGQWFGLGTHDGAETAESALVNYLSGYLIEECLSLDNIAVIAMILASFRVPLKYQHRVLFWGILGALVMRGIMIACGAALVSSFSWVLWIFGALLVYLSIKSTFGGDDDEDPQDKWITKFLMKHFRYDPKIEGMHFIRKIDGKTFLTPLLVALIVVEVSDVIFAVDSIPAIFGITQDPYIVFTSNIFAILGLRSLYFVLASILEKFSGLKYSVGAILMFVAIKLLAPAVCFGINHFAGTELESPFEGLPTWSNLAVIGTFILIGIIGSLIYDKKHPKPAKDETPASDDNAETNETENADAENAETNETENADAENAETNETENADAENAE